MSAQDEESARGRNGIVVQPRIGLTETLTDNVSQSSTSKDAALVTQVSPGIHIESRAGRVRGTFDYALNGVLYTGSPTANQTQHTLAAKGAVELIENSVYVDAQASINQQTISAFGQQSSSNVLSNANRTEVASVNVSPYWRGRLGDVASFELRAFGTATNQKESISGDSHTEGASLRLNGLNSGQIQWWASLSSQDSHFRAGSGSSSQSTIANLGLNYRPDVDLSLTISGGPERNDYGGGEMRNSSNYGASATWTPSPRTQLTGEWQHHDYGNAHTLSFEHRRARSVWRYSDVKSVTLGTPNGTTAGTTLYNLFYQQCVATQTDPASCPTVVTAYLLALGLDPNMILSSGFVASAPTSQRLQDLSFSLQGMRTTLMFSLTQSTSSLLSGAAATGDLAQSSFVRQRGFALSLSHGLTPISSVQATFSMSRNSGDIASLSNTLRSLAANWSSSFGRRLSVSLGARHSDFSGASGYTENALIANLVQQF
ncbi:TIGR03016 family PEP-CTERM system-associated outer membrane protein [Paucibacter sp. R3-3]|uniref:TIGR03016 family PEP-CTERM system-associated outer membrane protein n=1 Tax=Roseateles agri TaxID=3098619 RepID=A0ABU5DLP4_9BURK|nr:TIGR03016 family PEP-CTERM system-associated outer membrane protein [Paucibacter sp. R3-3]MDY0747232.1 TIGR03016 family PEP-CTERM system-associated outer membrane protein [Paucibacter sp. R3-3]